MQLYACWFSGQLRCNFWTAFILSGRQHICIYPILVRLLCLSMDIVHHWQLSLYACNEWAFMWDDDKWWIELKFLRVYAQNGSLASDLLEIGIQPPGEGSKGAEPTWHSSNDHWLPWNRLPSYRRGSKWKEIKWTVAHLKEAWIGPRPPWEAQKGPQTHEIGPTGPLNTPPPHQIEGEGPNRSSR